MVLCTCRNFRCTIIPRKLRVKLVCLIISESFSTNCTDKRFLRPITFHSESCKSKLTHIWQNWRTPQWTADSYFCPVPSKRLFLVERRRGRTLPSKARGNLSDKLIPAMCSSKHSVLKCSARNQMRREPRCMRKAGIKYRSTRLLMLPWKRH